jgi:hypothetical protein
MPNRHARCRRDETRSRDSDSAGCVAFAGRACLPLRSRRYGPSMDSEKRTSNGTAQFVLTANSRFVTQTSLSLR